MRTRMTLSPTMFDAQDSPAWLRELEEQGFCVIADVLDTDTREAVWKTFASEWTTVSPCFDWHDRDTWVHANCPMMWNKGMTYASGLAHSDAHWTLRTHPTVRSVWTAIHGTPDLVTSYDGGSLFFDPSQKPTSWLHTDQHQSDDTLSIQGAYNLLPTNELSAGFVIVPGSHLTHRHLEPPRAGSNFRQIPDDDPHRTSAVKLLIPANTLVLWNSKTVHCNTGMHTSLGRDFNRLTFYLCYFPKALRSDTVLEARLIGYRRGDNCGHIATRHDVKRHPFGQKARYEGRGFARLTPALTATGEIPPDRAELI